MKRDKSMAVEIVSTSKVHFPAFTICPFYQEAYDQEFLSKFGLNRQWHIISTYLAQKVIQKVSLQRDSYRLLQVNSQIGNWTMRQFHRRASLSLESLLDHILVDTYDGGYGIKILASNSSVWKEASDFLYGFCYTLELPESMTKSIIRKITFTFKRRYCKILLYCI